MTLPNAGHCVPRRIPSGVPLRRATPGDCNGAMTYGLANFLLDEVELSLLESLATLPPLAALPPLQLPLAGGAALPPLLPPLATAAVPLGPGPLPFFGDAAPDTEGSRQASRAPAAAPDPSPAHAAIGSGSSGGSGGSGSGGSGGSGSGGSGSGGRSGKSAAGKSTEEQERQRALNRLYQSRYQQRKQVRIDGGKGAPAADGG